MSRIRWILSSAAFAIHLAVAGRYDFFRDELYFIACGRHPAFGYADQPPLVPLLSAATQLFGEHLVLLRAAAALGAFGAVWFACQLAELFEAGAIGVVLAGTAGATAPMMLGEMSTLGTSTFEALYWGALSYLIARAVVRGDARAVVRGDARAWLWAGLVAGIDLETKYELPLRLVPLLAAIVATGRGRALLRREAFLGAAIAAAIALPSFFWQLAHGLPFLDLVRAGAAGKNTVVPVGAFLLNQVLVMNPIYVLLALAGVAAPFVDARFKEWRFLSVTFVLTAAAVMALHGKDYYLAPSYGPMRWIRPAWVKLAPLLPALALSAVAAPMAMPILDPPRLADYMRSLGIANKSGENLDQSDIPQTFADEMGWRTLTRDVAAAVRALPSEDQKRVVILGRNYGESGALEFFGPAYGLQAPVIGRHNQYWYWGPRGDGEVLILINWAPERVKDKCREVALLGLVSTPHAMPFENKAQITLCRGLLKPLAEEWPGLRLIL